MRASLDAEDVPADDPCLTLAIQDALG